MRYKQIRQHKDPILKLRQVRVCRGGGLLFSHIPRQVLPLLSLPLTHRAPITERKQLMPKGGTSFIVCPSKTLSSHQRKKQLTTFERTATETEAHNSGPASLSIAITIIIIANHHPCKRSLLCKLCSTCRSFLLPSFQACPLPLLKTNP